MIITLMMMITKEKVMIMKLMILVVKIIMTKKMEMRIIIKVNILMRNMI
jgi:hypothetical protein